MSNWKGVSACVTGSSSGIPDAPTDGAFYGRRNAAWANPNHSDITDWASALASYAPLLSPALVGAPTGPTPVPGDNSTKLATTAFVTAAVVASTAGVSSFNGRTGAVTPTSADVTGALGFTPYNSTNPAGYQTAAQVASAIAAIPAVPAPSSTVPAMDGTPAVGTGATFARADHVHPSDTSRAPLLSPTFTGAPAAPTPTAGDSSTKLATTAFVGGAISTAIGGIATPHAPTVQRFLTGSGTYTTPGGVTWLRVRARAPGAGGWGGGGPGAPGTPGTGAATLFGTSLISCGGGGIGSWVSGQGGAGGVATGPAGCIAINGGDGGTAVSGSSPLVGGGNGGGAGGGAGGGYDGSTITSGRAGAASSGGGGGGGTNDRAASTLSGPGGGEGAFVEAIIVSPAASYAYTVGTPGTAGPSGANGGTGGAGGSGGVWVEEHYGS